MSEPTGLRQRHKLERRRRLEHVALELFQQNGFDQTTIEQITAAAELSPRTFFSYFATKDDLVLADYTDRLERILDELDAQPANGHVWGALRDAFATVAKDYESAADDIRQRFMIMAANPSVFARSLQLQAGWEQVLAERLRGRLGVGSDDPTPRLLAASALAITRASIQQWLTVAVAPSLPELVQQGFDLLGTGLDPN